jgi:phosphatidylglycerol:prolipoprotein diacylglycerol transferase
MHPILLKLGPFTVYAYGAAMVAAFLASSSLATWQAQRLPAAQRALPAEHVTDFCLTGLLGGVIGGRLFYVVVAWEYFQQHLLEVFALWQGGLVWYGGLAGGLLAGGWYARRHRLALLPVLDQLAPMIALGHAIGRLGCFFNGCCYGVATHAWYGVWFPGHDAAVVPTQLLEAGGLVLLAGVLWRQQPALLGQRGRVFGWYLIGYALLRAGVELFRGDQPRFSGWTLPQGISLVVLLVGLGWLQPWRARTPSR